ncbi:hypothetical protein [Pandoravirus japonicus]|uniref:Uncharacterized protein n=1 Tax=Pandoravirus japonicus TaxID=2823154 RepID=A0A811BR74_9VIRU|nr:hypothetical protein [Pandoravirus japonicus]
MREPTTSTFAATLPKGALLACDMAARRPFPSLSMGKNTTDSGGVVVGFSLCVFWQTFLFFSNGRLRVSDRKNPLLWSFFVARAAEEAQQWKNPPPMRRHGLVSVERGFFYF